MSRWYSKQVSTSEKREGRFAVPRDSSMCSAVPPCSHGSTAAVLRLLWLQRHGCPDNRTVK
jgi:hypothetical protein